MKTSSLTFFNSRDLISNTWSSSQGMSAAADVINRQVLPLLIAGLGSSEKVTSRE